MQFVTFGLMPEGETGCSSPASVKLWYVAASGRRVRTSLGLRVGDPVTRLRRLYPHALRRRNAYWLVTRRELCIGICKTRYASASRLTAKVLRGRVSAFVVPVFAQGD